MRVLLFRFVGWKHGWIIDRAVFADGAVAVEIAALALLTHVTNVAVEGAQGTVHKRTLAVI